MIAKSDSVWQTTWLHALNITVFQGAEEGGHVTESTITTLNDDIGNTASLQLYQLSHYFNSCFDTGISKVDFLDFRLWYDPV